MYIEQLNVTLWWPGVVVSTLASSNKVNQCRTRRLSQGMHWVYVCGEKNYGRYWKGKFVTAPQAEQKSIFRTFCAGQVRFGPWEWLI